MIPLSGIDEKGPSCYPLGDMNLDSLLNAAQIILAVLLMAAILLQARGTGLGAAFGGSGNVYRTKRGVEKKLFQLTIILSILFFGVALANALV